MQVENMFTEPVIVSYDWKNKKILVADDIDLNFLLIKKFLSKTGASILWAKDGAEAVDFCENHQDIDLILMDIRMPNMNGFDATRIIKSKNPEMPIIAQTAYALDGDAERSIEAGCNHYVTKPINLKKFLDLIASYLDLGKHH